jgi:hypothetical protein
MPRVRFSRLGLAGFVAAVAVECAAPIYACAEVAGAAWMLTVLPLTFSGWLYVFTLVGPLSGQRSEGSTHLRGSWLSVWRA